MDDWKVGWARKDDKITGVMALGHSVPRCVYVDFLNTGPAVAKCLRTQVARADTVMRVSGLAINDVVVDDGVVVGAVGWNLEDETPVTVAANAVILAAGGLTRLYARNSASVNMNGDAYAMALRAGADLIDMEFPQFFPIGHLAPRLVGMDPIMILSGYKLLTLVQCGGGGISPSLRWRGRREIYHHPRYHFLRDNQGKRGRPGDRERRRTSELPAYSRRRSPRSFRPGDRQAGKANGIDLTKRTIEVSPIAHYHMGGIRVNRQTETGIPGLYGAVEAVGGANGANRLSGNAIPEAFVFGERAGKFAADYARGRNRSWSDAAAEEHLDRLKSVIGRQTDANGEKAALGEMGRAACRCGTRLRAADRRQNDRCTGLAYKICGTSRWHRARGRHRIQHDPAGLVRSAVGASDGGISALAAINRTESRGAHQREDFEEIDPGTDAQPAPAPRRRWRSCFRLFASGSYRMTAVPETVSISIQRGAPGEEKAT